MTLLPCFCIFCTHFLVSQFIHTVALVLLDHTVIFIAPSIDKCIVQISPSIYRAPPPPISISVLVEKYQSESLKLCLLLQYQDIDLNKAC